ncbi:MAG: Fe2+-dependent dioxygenase [Pacificimonas sp.]
MHFLTLTDILQPQELAQLMQIATSGNFVDGRISNPANTSKNNLQLHDEQAYRQSSQMLVQALMRQEEFTNFAFAKRIAPPLITKYEPGMAYGAHSDAAFIPLGRQMLRTDLSVTLFLADPDSYDGGELNIQMGARSVDFKLPPGSAVVYPSNTLHQVMPVTRGVRIAAISFIESTIADQTHRELLYDLNEVAALTGLDMPREHYVRLQHVQYGLKRLWADPVSG